MPTSTQGARASREFAAPPASVLVLQWLTSFSRSFHPFTMVNLGESFKIQAVLSSAWKTPGAQIGNAKETMRIALRSFALFLRILVLQPHVHSILHVSLHHPMQHSQASQNRCCHARPALKFSSMRWTACTTTCEKLRRHCRKRGIWHGIRVFIPLSIWSFAPPSTNSRNAVTQAEKRMPKLPCHDLRMPSTCGAGKFIDCMIQSVSSQWKCVS